MQAGAWLPGPRFISISSWRAGYCPGPELTHAAACPFPCLRTAPACLDASSVDTEDASRAENLLWMVRHAQAGSTMLPFLPL